MPREEVDVNRLPCLVTVAGLTGVMFFGVTGTAMADAVAPKPSYKPSYIVMNHYPGHCEQLVQREYRKCRRLPPVPYLRQACWARAALIYANCLAGR